MALRSARSRSRRDHVHPIKTYWHWGVDTVPLIAGRTPDGDTEGFDAALKAFKDAFTRWLAAVPPDKWQSNLEHKRAGAPALEIKRPADGQAGLKR
jgi:hypothetical protein